MTTGYKGTRLKATFPQLVKQMIQRHKDCNRKFGNSVFVMCTFNSTIHGDSNIILFSTQMLSHIMTKDKVTTTTTKNVLTWQQIECLEKVYAILEAVKDHFKEKEDARNKIKTIDNHCMVYYCSVHNYKMFYLLLGHCHWQCNNSLYPLCGCNHGVGARDNDKHTCKMINDKEHLELWQKSVDQCNNLQKQEGFNKTPYQLKIDVYECAGKDNKGVTHYGCHPLMFKLSEAYSDMFHQDCAITKTLLGSV